MEENHPIEKLMVTAMNSIKQMIDVNTIIGEPIQALDNTVIIPISKVGFGFAAGGSEFTDETVNSYNRREKEENIKYRLPFGGGSGAGVNISPVAFLIVQNDSVKLLEASHTSVLDKLVEYIPDAIDKINGIIKRKMDKNDIDFESDDFQDKDFDDNYNNSDDNNGDFEHTDDDWPDGGTDTTSANNKQSQNKHQIVVEENKEVNCKDGKEIKELHKKEVNKIVDEGKGNTKKLEEKIREIKKETDNL